MTRPRDGSGHRLEGDPPGPRDPSDAGNRLAADGVLDRFHEIRVWARGDERAPHKPLLLLYMLARLQSHEERLVSYEEIHPVLEGLLRDFGPKRKSYHPEFPFWHLYSDRGLWEIPERGRLEELVAARRGRSNLSAAALRRQGARGGFPVDLHASLRRTPDLVNRVAAGLLEAHFPPSLHNDILDAVGMPLVERGRRLTRDPRFRDMILRIYEHRCAVCGYDGRVGHSDLGLEAAHVKWHAAGGPDDAENGLALCSFHHKALDRGALGLDDDRRILVSQEVHGHERVTEWLLDFIGESLIPPMDGEPPPAPSFITWHREQVFRGPARGGR